MLSSRVSGTGRAAGICIRAGTGVGGLHGAGHDGAIAGCAHDDFIAASAEQAAALREWRGRLLAARLAALQRAQKAWLAWRTEICTFEASAAAGGSPGTGVALAMHGAADARAHGVAGRGRALPRRRRRLRPALKCLWLLALLFGLLGGLLGGPGMAALPVPVDGGRVQGLQSGVVAIHLGLPYAAAPVGERRWRRRIARNRAASRWKVAATRVCSPTIA